jgi:hypothetical protein
VSCLEHGRLLNRLRGTMAGVFGELKHVLEMFLALSSFTVTTMEGIQRDSDRQRHYFQVCVCLPACFVHICGCGRGCEVERPGRVSTGAPWGVPLLR